MDFMVGFHNTENATSLPSARGCSVVLYCEVWKYRGGHDVAWRAALKASGWGYYVAPDGAAKANTPTWDPAVWEPVDGGFVETVKGVGGITPSRSYVWVRLRHKATGLVVRFVVTHLVSKARLRPRMWRRHRDMLEAFVTECVAAGENVVVAGDFNRRPAYVALKPLRLVVASQGADHGPIDQIWSNLAGDGRMGRDYGSDHPFMRATLSTDPVKPPKPEPKPEPAVTDDRYELTTHDGKTVDRMTKQAIEKAERRLGYPLDIVQGSYHRGVSQSAGTHDGGGVVDMKPWDWENKVRVLREIGFAAWHRTPSQGPWGEHIHAVLIGDEKASPSALRQVESYKAGRNGLAGNGVDDFWRPKVIKAYKYTPPPPPSRVTVFRAAVEEALAVTLPQIDAVDRPAAYRMLKAVQAALDAGPRA